MPRRKNKRRKNKNQTNQTQIPSAGKGEEVAVSTAVSKTESCNSSSTELIINEKCDGPVGNEPNPSCDNTETTTSEYDAVLVLSNGQINDTDVLNNEQLNVDAVEEPMKSDEMGCVDHNNVIATETNDDLIKPDLINVETPSYIKESDCIPAKPDNLSSASSDDANEINDDNPPTLLCDSTNETATNFGAKAVISNCFTYDVEVHCDNEEEHHDDTILVTDNHSLDNENIDMENTEIDISEPSRDLKEEIVKHTVPTTNQYEVEMSDSTDELRTNLVNGQVKKSHSFGDRIIHIQEMSDSSSVYDNENTPIVSEVESELDSERTEVFSDTLDSPPAEPFPLVPESHSEFNHDTDQIQYNEQIESPMETYDNVPISSTSANDIHMRRAKTRSELALFLQPQMLNPRYLDSIKEESSDASDVERKSLNGSTSTLNDIQETLPSPTSPLDKTGKNMNVAFPKSSLDFTKTHKSLIMKPTTTANVIREEPICYRLETKLVDSELPAKPEDNNDWITTVVSDVDNYLKTPEIVYLESGSSSTSSLLDYAGDIEDEQSESDVRIQTPVINDSGTDVIFDSAVSGYSSATSTTSNENLQLATDEISDVKLTKNSFLNLDSVNVEHTNDKSAICNDNLMITHGDKDNLIDKENSNKTDLELTNTLTETNQIDSSTISEIAKEFDKNIEQMVHEIHRQDSSGSISSSHSHSTNHSQNTARFLTLSQTDLTDLDSTASVSGALNDDNKWHMPSPLRQICYEKLAQMPFGATILEELAKVAESLSDLTSKYQSNETNEQPDMSYPIPKLPNIKKIEIKSDGTQNTDYKNVSVRLVPILKEKSKSPSPPPIPERPKPDAWLGIPTENDANVLVCVSPAQRQLLNQQKAISSPDLLLEMHQKFVKRRGYHENIAPDVNTQNEIKTRSGKSEFDSDAKDSRLLAIIRNSQNSSEENDIKPLPVSCSEEPIQTSDTMFYSTPSDYHRRFSNIESFAFGNPPIFPDQPKTRRYSNIETTSYKKEKRIENGQVVYESVDSNRQQFSDGDKTTKKDEKIGENKIGSLLNLDHNNESENKTANKTTENTKQISENKMNRDHNNYSEMNRNDTEKINDTVTDKSKWDKEKARRDFFNLDRSFSYIDQLLGSAIPFSSSQKNQLFNSPIQRHDTEHVKTFSEETRREERQTETTKIESSRDTISKDSQYSSLHPKTHLGVHNSNVNNWLFDIDESSEYITKPIFKEEQICRGIRSNQVKAPRLNNDMDSKYQFYHTMNSPSQSMRQSMYNTSMNHHYENVNLARGKSLPKDIHPKKLEHQEEIRLKERELQEAFEQTERQRREIVRELQQLHSKAPNKNPLLNEKDKQRAKIQQEWLNKCEEREQRRHNKIIKISNPNEIEHHSSLPRPDLPDEFINRVKERRVKLNLPSDSDWDSGAESQPQPRQESVDNKLDPNVKIIDGKREIKLQEIPKHIREFAEEFTRLTSNSDYNNRTESYQKEYQSTSTSIMKQHRSDKQPTMIAPKFKATAPAGIWSPNNKQHSSSTSQLDSKTSHTNGSTEPASSQPIWTPRSADPSPTLGGRKEFRPVRFESPVLGRKRFTSDSGTAATPPPWAGEVNNNNQSTDTQASTNSRNLSTFQTFHSNPGILKNKSSSTSSLRSPKDVHFANNNTDREPPRQNYFQVKWPAKIPAASPIDFYHMKYDYTSEPEISNERSKMMENASVHHHHTDTMRNIKNSGITELTIEDQGKWYKKMYNTLHKVKQPDDYLTVRYKTRRGRYPYKTNGYMSEPDTNYDSEYSSSRYSTLNNRNNSNSGSHTDLNNKFTYATLPNPVKSYPHFYKNQPGKIENYIPGRSSIAEKEKKEWWDEVMDIFNGWLDENSSKPFFSIRFAREVAKFNQEQEIIANRYKNTEGYLSRALKDKGYESDSTLVFRKKENSQMSPLSPIEQKQAYKSLQAGGEAPLQGFRKPAPEKPKEFENAYSTPLSPPPLPPPPPPVKGVPLNSNQWDEIESPRRYVERDVNIHYRSPVRFEFKTPIPESELSYKQAESMDKYYQEERRRKYLQELQDMNRWRHHDYSSASPKSPIPLNRYDDFPVNIPPRANPPTRTVARALYNFQGQSTSELSFKKGDIIYIKRQIDPNWFEGEHNAMFGLLPANYVEIISKNGARIIATTPKKLSEGQARAKFNFQAQSGIELSLNKGELVTLTRRVDDNWFEGKIANRKGIFPVSYVEVLTDIGAEELIPKPVGAPAAHSLITDSNRNNYSGDVIANGHPVVRETKTVQKTEVLHVDTNSEPIPYRALYKYQPQNSDELELNEGDIVYVMEKCDDGWYVGTSDRTGYFGTFPGNYVVKM